MIVSFFDSKNFIVNCLFNVIYFEIYLVPHEKSSIAGWQSNEMRENCVGNRFRCIYALDRLKAIRQKAKAI